MPTIVYAVTEINLSFLLEKKKLMTNPIRGIKMNMGSNCSIVEASYKDKQVGFPVWRE